MLYDKKNMANAFNEYFATICTNNSPCNSTVPRTNYLKASIHSTFKFKTFNNAVALQYLSNLKPSKSCGHDSISSIIDIVYTPIHTFHVVLILYYQIYIFVL